MYQVVLGLADLGKITLPFGISEPTLLLCFTNLAVKKLFLIWPLHIINMHVYFLCTDVSSDSTASCQEIEDWCYKKLPPEIIKTFLLYFNSGIVNRNLSKDNMSSTVCNWNFFFRKIKIERQMIAIWGHYICFYRCLRN